MTSRLASHVTQAVKTEPLVRTSLWHVAHVDYVDYCQRVLATAEGYSNFFTRGEPQGIRHAKAFMRLAHGWKSRRDR
jgi:hypothetical protein